MQGLGLYVFIGLLKLQSILILQNVHFSEMSVFRHDRRSHATCFLSLSFLSEHDKITVPASPGDPCVTKEAKGFLCLLSFSIFFKAVRQRGEFLMVLETERSECKSCPLFPGLCDLG